MICTFGRGGAAQTLLSAMLEPLTDRPPVLAVVTIAVLLLLAYLVRLNQLLLGTPPEIEQLVQKPWTADLLVETYKRLEANPITTESYAKLIPPKLERRYIVTGGSGKSAAQARRRHAGATRAQPRPHTVLTPPHHHL